jgi:hypothetical protein
MKSKTAKAVISVKSLALTKIISSIYGQENSIPEGETPYKPVKE